MFSIVKGFFGMIFEMFRQMFISATMPSDEFQKLQDAKFDEENKVSEEPEDSMFV